MKKNFTFAKSLFVACLSVVASAAGAQEVVFKETFGTPASEKDELLEDHVWGENPSSMFASALLLEGSSVNVRSNNPSDYEGASGDGNLYFKGCASFSILGISTADRSSLNLSFGAFGKKVDDVKLMKVEYAKDGGAKALLADFASLDLNTGKKKWTKVENIALPQANSLDLTFTSNLTDLLADGGIRLDDITVTGSKVGTAISQVSDGSHGVLAANHSLLYLGQQGRAVLYTSDGRKVAELLPHVSFDTAALHGVFILKMGNQSRKIVLE